MPVVTTAKKMARSLIFTAVLSMIKEGRESAVTAIMKESAVKIIKAH